MHENTVVEAPIARTTVQAAVQNPLPARLASQPAVGELLPQDSSPAWQVLRACTSGGGEPDWNELVRRFEPQLRRVVRRLLVRQDPAREPDEIDDFVQDVYCRLLSAGRRPSTRFRGTSEAEATVFLNRIAVRVLLDARRGARAGKRGGGRRVAQLRPEMAGALPAPAIDSPDSRLERHERRLVFRRRCRELLGRSSSPASVRIAELALIDGLSSAEIARRPGVALRESGINSIVYRLRCRLGPDARRLPRRRAVRRG